MINVIKYIKKKNLYKKIIDKVLLIINKHLYILINVVQLVKTNI